MRALAAAIDVNDRIDLAAPLPPTFAFDVPPERFADGFRLSRQLWEERFDAAATAALAARLARGGAKVGERDAFKQVRAAFKHLRFAFFLYDRRHRAPPILSLVTLEMGELQDAVRVGQAAAARRHGAALRALLAPPLRPLLRREIGLEPTDAAGSRAFTDAQLASLRPLLGQVAVDAHAFHAARKVVSRQVSFHDDMRTLAPEGEASAAHRAAARWLATLNGLMGAFHDELVTRAAAGGFRYGRDTVALPPAIRERLALLSRGTSSS